ncbi:MotB family protein [Cohaesibacter celericrescens]|uniref:OmpA-like domain-containing protein n=1 Tax=Cohaesibacter celericrescens TaxID=2067669 RepID=A0A2N5XWN9_9HYPH|nr:MotB family protein [Cohaesibacter celericrescens]PLW75515.1 hypothetical protein C0081_19445 [Cohaesibacter celericrescens]PLW78922.1 hypothetical protein C0081_01405 [Cohaesibacter celericrescens]
MAEESTEREPELIIVRRRYDADLDAPHGGVWKIAHADFMTAMMAFFLVMWLASATDEETRKDIAQYFNPVKLAEMTPHQKGLQDPEEAAPKPDDTANEEGKKFNGKSNTPSTPRKFSADGGRVEKTGTTNFKNLPTYSEAEIFSDPYGILNRIMASAQQMEKQESPSEGASDNDGKIGNKGGAALRDPFDPLYWQLKPEKPEIEQDNLQVEVIESKVFQTQLPRINPMLSDTSIVKGIITGNDPATEITPEPPMGTRHASSGEEPEDAASLEPTDTNASGPKTTSKPQQKRQAEKLALYKDRLAQELGKSPRLVIGNELTVTQKGDGMLIDVTDKPSWSMFAVGSSEPSARSIALLEKIANSLKTVKGKIIIRGHTDSRPFRNKGNDNWRLSTARAHMARHMLIRGGLDETRLWRVEGYADRELKQPDKPEAANNRRIEILVQPDEEAGQ